jgi:cysteine desulfurase/selenocysteine lyase
LDVKINIITFAVQFVIILTPMTTDKLTAIRSDFPILEECVYGKPLIYFDNAATTQKPRCVVEKIAQAYYHCNANIHRGVHYLSLKATEAHEEARRQVALYINAARSCEIIFTSGATAAINLVATSFGEKYCREGDEILISAMEHHSNIVPWQMLCERKNLKLRVIPVNRSNGELLPDEYAKLLNEKTRIVAITQVSNVLGTENPVREMIDLAHRKNIPVLIDGAQAIPHLAIDVRALDADFYVFSAHKIYGPAGTGILYGKEKYLEEMPPYQGGGEMIASVSFQKTTYNELPYKFEAGTPDYIGSQALAEALSYVKSIGIDSIAAHETALTKYCTQRLMEIEGMKIIGTAARKTSVISFVIDKIHPYDTGMMLDKLGIAIRTGYHCAQPLIDFFQIPGAARVSFALYNTESEIDIFIDALKRTTEMLR